MDHCLALNLLARRFASALLRVTCDVTDEARYETGTLRMLSH